MFKTDKNARNAFMTKFDPSRAFRGTNWEGSGHYWQRVDAAVFDFNWKGISCLNITKTIIKVFKTSEQEAAKTKHGVGEEVTNRILQTNTNRERLVCEFIGCCVEMRPTEVPLDEIEKATEDDQPLQYVVVEVDNEEVYWKDKNTGETKGPITDVRYKRIVPWSEVLRGVTEEEAERFFPDGLLSNLAEADEVLV